MKEAIAEVLKLLKSVKQAENFLEIPPDSKLGDLSLPCFSLSKNPKKFAEELASKENLFCKEIFYYTCPPFQSNKPIGDEANRKKGYDKFINALLKNKNILVISPINVLCPLTALYRGSHANTEGEFKKILS